MDDSAKEAREKPIWLFKRNRRGSYPRESAVYASCTNQPAMKLVNQTIEVLSGEFSDKRLYAIDLALVSEAREAKREDYVVCIALGETQSEDEKQSLRALLLEKLDIAEEQLEVRYPPSGEDAQGWVEGS